MVGTPFTSLNLSKLIQPASNSFSDKLKKKSLGQSVISGFLRTLVSKASLFTTDDTPWIERIRRPCFFSLTILPLPLCLYMYPSLTNSVSANRTVGRVMPYNLHSSFSDGNKSPSL